jgi:hypothetical protein
MLRTRALGMPDFVHWDGRIDRNYQISPYVVRDNLFANRFPVNKSPIQVLLEASQIVAIHRPEVVPRGDDPDTWMGERVIFPPVGIAIPYKVNGVSTLGIFVSERKFFLDARIPRNGWMANGSKWFYMVGDDYLAALEAALGKGDKRLYNIKGDVWHPREQFKKAGLHFAAEDADVPLEERARLSRMCAFVLPAYHQYTLQF